MRVGPLAVVRASGLSGLHSEHTRYEAELHELQQWLARPMIMHHARAIRVAPPMVLAPDGRDGDQRRAITRVLTAYEKARAEERGSKLDSMWELVAERQSEFIAILERGDEDALGEALSQLMQSELVWGISGQLPEMLQELVANPQGSRLQLTLTDELVSLGEAVGAVRVSCYQQGSMLERLDLDVDLDALVDAIETRTGLDLAFPQVGGPYGCEILGKLVTLDSVRHSYTVHLIRRLGANEESRVVEIGGGFGCFAALCHRAGIDRIALFDLPWVNALQGYFLLMTLPPGTVRLYGEEHGTISVEPHWAFDQLSARSVDFVVNTNSLPEVGYDAGRRYVEGIGRVLRGCFVSMNQEGKLPVGTFGPQNCVRELVEESGLLTTAYRARNWVWEGYVDEVFVPPGTSPVNPG